MVLDFGKGPDRFGDQNASCDSPGPGAYDPKNVDRRLPPKSGFLSPRSYLFSAGASGGAENRATPNNCGRKLDNYSLLSGALTPRRLITPRRNAPCDKLQASDQGVVGTSLPAEDDANDLLPVNLSLAEMQLPKASHPVNSSQAVTHGAQEPGVQRAGVDATAELWLPHLPVSSGSTPSLHTRKVSITETAPSLCESLVADLSEQLGNAQAELLARSRQLAAAEAELAELQRREAALASEVSTKEESAAILRTQMASHASELASLRFSVGTLQVEREAAQQSLLQRDRSLADALAAAKEIERTVSEQNQLVQSQTAELQKRTADLESTLVREKVLIVVKAQSEMRLESQTARCAELEKIAESLEQQVVILQHQTATSSDAASTMAQLQAANSTIEKQLQQLEERSNRVARLEMEVDALSNTMKKQAQAFERRGRTIEELRSIVSRKEAESADLSTQLLAERANAQMGTQEVMRLSLINAKRNSIVASLQGELAKLRGGFPGRGGAAGAGFSGLAAPRDVQLPDQLAAAEQRLKDAEDANQGLQEQCSKLAAELDAAKETNRQLQQGSEDLVRQYTALVSEVQQLQLDGERNCALIQQIATIESELESKRVELAAEKEEGEKLDSLCKRVQTRASELCAQLVEETKNSKTLASEVLRLSAALQERDDTIALLKPKLEDLDDTILDRDKEISAATSKLQQRFVIEAELQESIARLQEAAAGKDAMLADLKALLADRSAALEDCELRISQLLQESATSASSSRERIDGLETSLTKAGTEVASLQRAVSGLKATRAELQQQLALQREQSASFVTDLSAAQAALEASAVRQAQLSDRLAVAEQHSGLKQQLQEKCAQMDELQETYDSVLESLVGMTGQLAALHSHLHELQQRGDEEAAAWGVRLAAAERELDGGTSKLLTLDDEASMLRLALADNQALMSDQATELAAAKAELAALAVALAAHQRMEADLKQQLLGHRATACKVA